MRELLRAVSLDRYVGSITNVKQNDPRMPPNPYVGYYGVVWLNGFESELRRHVVFTPSTGGFRDIGERLPFR
jgi:hypothetical protein